MCFVGVEWRFVKFVGRGIVGGLEMEMGKGKGC